MVRESIGCRRCPTTLLTVTDYLKVLLSVTVTVMRYAKGSSLGGGGVGEPAVTAVNLL